MVEVCCDGLDLLLIQAVRDRRHDGRGVRVRWILPAFLGPIGQFVDNVVAQLTGQTRKLAVAFRLRPMTSGARRNVGAGYALFVDFLARRNELFGSGRW